MGQLDDKTALVTGASVMLLSSSTALRAAPGLSTPLGRVGHPDEVAATALYLAGDQSTFTTGAELFVDGGATQL
ncbi:MAG: SDR family oxidoreductase [Streptomyces sp.]|nr:SDR family oxidoreductase [Streptomyces sp.]NUS83926.1 SDR family oxidoreductase [Streptomyces sp.]